MGIAAAAAALVFGYKQVALIKAQKYQSTSTGQTSAGGSMGSAPTIVAPKVQGATAPEIQTGQGMNPTTQIAQSINNSQAPLKAYVVSGEVSSQIALDRRTSRAATFVGG